MTHRFQILLDEERFQRVQAIARQQKVSAAAVIRQAIDRGLPADSHRRAAAARRILEAPDMDVPSDPADLRRELDDAHGRNL